MSLLATGAPNMRRRLTVLVAAPVALTMSMSIISTPAANAQVPDIVRMAPAGTEVFIGTGNLGDVDRQFTELLTAVQLNNMFPFRPTNIFDEMGMDATTLDQTRPAGIALLKGVFDQDGGMDETPPMLLFLPVSDYGNWLHALAPDADVNSIAQIDMGDAENPGFARQVGSYAVVGPNKEDVEAYKPASGPDAEHIAKRIGSVGADLARRCQLYALIDFAGLETQRDAIIAAAQQGLDENMAPMAAMGGMGQMNPDQMNAMVTGFINLFFDEASAAGVGVRASSKGLAFDLSVQTKDGSELGATLPGNNEPRNLLSNFTDAPFMMAMSWDTRAIKLVDLTSLLEKRLDLAALKGGNASPTPNVWKDADGMAMVMYPPPGGFMNGLLTKSVFMFAGNSEKLLDAMQKATQSVDGMNQNGVLFSTTYTKDAQQIAGRNADAYSIKMQFPPEMQQVILTSMQMIYGSALGPEGYVVPVKGGILQTISKNNQVVEQIIATQNGENANLGDNRVLAAADELLPPRPMMRTYVGLGTLIDQFGPWIGAFVPGLNLEELAALPPLAFSMNAADGGMITSFAIPAPVLKSAAEIAQQFSGMGGGPDGAGQEEAPLF